MNIVEFFQQSSGKWFSQRTSHHLTFNQSQGGQSNIVIEMLSSDDPVVVQLCQQYAVEPALALCGVRITWDGTMELDAEKQEGSTVLVPIANSDNPNEGKLLRGENTGSATAIGRYSMGSDDALTLITEQEALYSEERLWFASPNLRLRTTLLKRSSGFSMASFCSEIRMGGVQPAQASTGSTAQAK